MATDTEMSFEEYLVKKNINGESFQKAEPKQYTEWENIFAKIHPDSFTMQKKFLINAIRRNYEIKKP